MQKLYSRTGTIETVVSAACLVSCCLVIFIAALARAFDRPLNWSQDLSLFLFAWSVFLSADVALRKDRMVRFELLVDKFSPKVARIVAVACYLIIFGFLIALVIYGIKLSFISYQRVFQGIPGVSYTWVTLSVPVGSLLMSVTTIRKIYFLVRPDRKEQHGGAQ